MKPNKIILNLPFIAIGLILLFTFSCRRDDQGTPQVSYPIDASVLTTLDHTVMPVNGPFSSDPILPCELSKYAQFGYGFWQNGPGFGYKKSNELMPGSYNGSSVTVKADLLRFFTMSDIHLTDKESPTQQIEWGYKGGVAGNSSAYSGVILYTTHVLDAAIQTINALNKANKFDFGMGLGDAINNAQYNELRWYIDIFDGKKITPDSGKKDDPIPGPGNDYQDEFQAAGLNSEIPWYQVLGNHDHFCTGMFTPDDYVWKTYTGSSIMNMGNIMTDPLGLKSRGFYMGAVDGTTPNGDIIGAGPVGDYSEPPTLIADASRHYINRRSWMNEFFNTTSKPVGHGFSQTNLDLDFACYSFVPKSDVPIKVIVFDDTQNEDRVDMHEQGYVTQSRFEWLVGELDAGQKTGQLMIISAHIPLMFIDQDNDSPIDLKTITDKLHTYSNLILWMSGHVHRNMVTPFPSADTTHPELGFWHVETASLRDFPQQFRTFRVVSNSDSTVSIFVTDVDPAVKAGSLAAASRSFAIGAVQIFKTENQLTYPESGGAYNAELRKQLSTEMKKKIMKSGISAFR
ncbi:MAG: TIGR03768 family metallophosphoesterase [Bacteroidota bacterium]